MKNGYLSKEAERNLKSYKSLLVKLGVVVIAAVALLYFLTRADAEASQLMQKIVLGVLVILIIAIPSRILKAKGQQKNYGNLFVHSKDITKEAAGNTIDREAEQGKILVEAYLDESASESKPKGDKIVLLPSYLLLCGKTVTAIPVDKIFWICAQVGYKGGPYIVRFKVFAEHMMYHLDGTDIEHVKNIADKIYQHIPNVFSEYDTYDLSYRLEELFSRDYDKFCEFYQEHKQALSEKQQ